MGVGVSEHATALTQQVAIHRQGTQSDILIILVVTFARVPTGRLAYQ